MYNIRINIHLTIPLASCRILLIPYRMKLTVNFEPEEFPESSLSVTEVMRKRNYTFPHIITRVNGKLVPRESRDLFIVGEGDDVELYHLISGG